MGEKEQVVIPTGETAAEQPTPTNPEIEELKLQNEYLLDVVKKMAKHLNCEGLL